MPNRLLDILRMISEVIAKSGDHRSVLSEIVDILAESLKVEVCSVYIYEESSDELVLTATKGLHIDSVGKVRMKNGEGLTGVSFKTRDILNLADPAQDPRFMFFEETGEERYKSFLSVPLTVGGRCVGILVIQREKPERFRPMVIDMVKSLSTQLANLILNARMLQELAAETRPSVAEKRDVHGAAQIMLRGLAANAGIAVGHALVFEPMDFFEQIEHGVHAGAERELTLLERAIQLTKEKTVKLEKVALEMISEADASIFNVHLLFLEDKSLIDKIKGEVVDEGHTLEFSVKQVYKEYERRFMALGDHTFRDRIMDLKDVSLRLLETIRGLRCGKAEPDGALPINGNGKGCILVAKELLPSDLVRMPVGDISGIVCEKGGVTAHVAILAKALDIPALMGVRGVTEKTSDGDELIVDCHAELVYIRPAEHVKAHFRDLAGTRNVEERPVDFGPTVTADGQDVILRANISLICETSLLQTYGARGIGLYRTEFLYMVRDYLPSEEDQYRVFSKIVAAAGDDEATIRVLDIGGDKPVPCVTFPREDNPALGNRGVRYLLSKPDIFKTHLKAILRAGAQGRLKILFPMVSNSGEIVQIRQILSDVETELHGKSVPHADDYKLGIMLEVPSAVFALDQLIDDVDYMSVGSNDLLQYTFAADRGNEAVATSHQFLHPIFLKILESIGRTFRSRPEKGLALCGEMAGNTLAAPFLLGAGFRELSMPPKRIPTVKRVIQGLSTLECESLLKEAIRLKNPEAVACLVKAALADRSLAE